MAFSSGPRGGGEGGSGSSRVGFVSEKQSSTAITVQNHGSNFTDATITPAWQLTLKDSGRAEIVYGTLISVSNGASTTNVRYSARLRVRSSNSRDSGYGNWSTVELLPSNNNLIFDDLQHYDNEATFYHTVQGAIPFDLSDLPDTASDNQYLQFMVQFRASADGSPTFAATNGYIALKSFGVGAGSTDVGPSELGLAEGAGQANKFVKYNSTGTGFAGETLIANSDLANDSVTKNKIAANAVDTDQIATDAVEADQIATGAVGSDAIATGAVGVDELASNAVTGAKIASGAVGSGALANGAVGETQLAADAVTPDKMAGITTGSGAGGYAIALNDAGTAFESKAFPQGGGGGGVPANNSITHAMLRDGIVENDNMADDAITPAEVAGITPGSTNAGQVLALDTTNGTAFVTRPYNTGGGGGISSVDPSDLDGVTGGSGDASKFVKTDSTGNEFEVATHVTASDVGLTGGGSDAGKFVTLDSAGTGFNVHGDIEPDDIGLGDMEDRGKLVQVNSTGDGFVSVSANSGGATVTLDNITGNPLATTKGGTGLNASDINDLRNKLGIQTQVSNATLPYSTDVGTQKDGTIDRVNSSTASLPSGVADGIVVRISNDQWAVNLADGRQWKRTLTDTPGSWGSSTNATLSSLSTIADLRGLAEGNAGVMTTGNFRPQYPDGNYAAKVIVGRHGEHDDDHDDELIAMDRHNFWWADRPGDSDTTITWHWEGTGLIPSGLYYTGGETDEEHIPVGSVAVLGGKTGIDGEEYINIMVGHSLNAAKTTSTYTGYWIDDDASETVMVTQNTRGYVQGTWSRVKLDHAGIDDDIISFDTTANEAVFLGIVPAINNLTFTGYNFKTSGNVAAGDVLWNSTQRVLRVVHALGDDHVNDIFQSDYEVEIKKDNSNYIRGVFGSPPATPPGVVQAQYRADDLKVVGTINDDDVVSILGHKAVITKTDDILPVNLGLSHGSGQANKVITYNSTGDEFAATEVTHAMLGSDVVEGDNIADDAITPAHVAGLTTGSGASDYAIALNSTGTAFVSKAFPDSTPGAGSITHAMLGSEIVETDNIDDDAITPAKMGGITTGSGAGGYAIALNTAGTAFESKAFPSTTPADLSITTAKLAADAVTEAKLADNAVVPANIKGITPGSTEANKLLALDGNGTGFTLATASGGGGGGGQYIARLPWNSGSSLGSNIFNKTGIIYYSTNGLSFTNPFTIGTKSSASFAFKGAGFDAFFNGSSATSIVGTFKIHLQHRWKGRSESFANWSAWTDLNVADDNTNAIFSRDLNITAMGSNQIRFNYYFNVDIASSDFNSDVANNDTIQFRLGTSFDGSTSTFSNFGLASQTGSAFLYTAGGGSGGGTPGAGSIGTTQLANDAVTNAKIADDAVDLENLAHQYKVLDDSYTFQANVASGVDDGKFGYTDSGLNGQIAFNVKSGDSGAISEFTTDSVLVLYKDASNFVIGRTTAAPQTEAGDATEGAVSVNELERQGTFANGDSVKLYYGSNHEPGAVMQLDNEGGIVFDHLSPSAMAIPQATAYGSRAITTNANADGFLAVPPANLGLIKATLLCRQEIAGSGEISVSSTNGDDTRAALQTQTGTWTVANRTNDWIRFSAGGLCYFGTPTAQPICADFAVLVRWANGSETFQSWVTTNSRVAQVDLGSDRLMVVKLYAGNSAGSAHVDCAVGSGYKFLKLSQLPAGIVDGTRVQFTLGFAFQSPSPPYTARRFFLTGEVLDGGRIYANY